jgi:hypothetical protein
MTSVPPTIAGELALTRQNIALSVIKQAHEQEKALVSILDQAVRNAPINQSLGSNVNISA